LLLELYLVFPLLFRLLQKLGTVWFLVLCGMVTLISRYALLCVISANGYYVQGAFFGARLWEFAAGMALGLLYRRHQVLTEERLFTGWAFLAGVALYTLGLYSYATTLSYTVTDPLIGTGLFIILAHVTLWSGLLPRLGGTLAYIGAFSYGLYLLHQPYVIYCGERMRGLSLPVFIVLACVIIALITMGAIPVERYVNQLTSRVLDRKRESRQTVKEGARQPAA